MEKKFEDEELDKLIDEQFIKEAQMMEEALFSDDDFEDYEASDEEVKASYQDLVGRLKADGIYREDTNAASTTDVPVVADKVVPISKKRNFAIRHKFGKVAGFVVVCGVCIFAVSMTSEANRNYFVESIKLLAGDDTQVIVGNDDNNEDIDVDEYEAIADIENNLGVDVPEFLYRPKYFSFYNYEVNSYVKAARIEYSYKDSIIELRIDKDDETSSSHFDIIHGKEVDNVNIKSENIDVAVRKIQNEQDEIPNYIAQWKKDNTVYYLTGKIEIGEFFKMIEEIRY